MVGGVSINYSLRPGADIRAISGGTDKTPMQQMAKTWANVAPAIRRGEKMACAKCDSIFFAPVSSTRRLIEGKA
ncbi:hypothetical protein IF1G_04700 [Cordyceps javanica]|uniref:Uncharacterized protein n=1 Tax=Cordyceps javanica TaxID=43265 RepID=A0A545V334_9HYPO|nr:hypothetical protein IF1G_04700 [Cordyceps javanica]